MQEPLANLADFEEALKKAFGNTDEKRLNERKLLRII
jgi:hypothetical protein